MHANGKYYMPEKGITVLTTKKAYSLTNDSIYM